MFLKVCHFHTLTTPCFTYIHRVFVNWMVLYWYKLKSTSTEDNFCHWSLFEISLKILMEKSFKSRQYILSSIYLRLEKGVVFYLKKTLYSHFLRMLCVKFWLKSAHAVVRQLYFRSLATISGWKRTQHFIGRNETNSSKNALCQVWLKYVRWFGRRR